jgi:hypothetical protein
MIMLRLPQVRAELADTSSQALAQERSQGCSVDVADLGGDGVEVEAATVQKRLRPFDTQILKIGKWRFAKHRFAATLQGAGARRQSIGGFL